MDFIINLSPPKTGTTYIFNCLKQTKEFDVPALKEPKYYLEENLIPNLNLPHGLKIESNKKKGENWYKSIYSNNDKTRLDFTTLYNLNKKKISFSEKNNEVFILILRNPMDRLISHYFQYSKMGITLPPIEQAFIEPSDIAEFFRMFISSKRIVELYQEQKLLIFDFKDLKAKNDNLKNYLKENLNSDKFDFFEIDKYTRGKAKSKFIGKLLFNPVTSKISKWLPKTLYSKAILIRKKIIKLNTNKIVESKNFILNHDNCYFYSELIKELDYQNNYEYEYK